MILLSNGNLASCSLDKTVKIWEIKHDKIIELYKFEEYSD